MINQNKFWFKIMRNRENYWVKGVLKIMNKYLKKGKK